MTSSTSISPRARLAAIPGLNRLVLHGDRWVLDVFMAAAELRQRLPPSLASQSRRWRERLRQPPLRPPGPGASPLLLICPITTLDDLDLTPALVQVLTSAVLRPHVLCLFPTDAAAQLQRCRARDEELHQLLEFTALAEFPSLLDRLDGHDHLLVLPVFSWLTPAGLAQLEAALGGSAVGHAAGSVHQRVSFADPSSGLALFQAQLWHRGEVPAAPPAGSPALALPMPTLITQLDRQATGTLPGDLLPVDSDLGTSQPVCEPFLPAPRPLRRLPLQDVPDGLRIPPDAAAAADELILRDGRPEVGGGITHFCHRFLRWQPAQQPLRFDPPLLSVAEQPLRAEVVLAGTAAGERSAPFSLHVPPHRLEPWMLTAYLNRGGGGNSLIRAFADGVGCPLRYAEDEAGYRPGVPVVWGVLRGSDRVLSHARARGQYFFYCDHAYLDRGHGRSYRITRNAYEAGRVRVCPGDRLEQLGLSLDPWRSGGRSILICPPTDFFMAAHGCQGWLERTLEVLRGHTDRPLVIREKPRPGESVQPLHEALRDAHALVCHSSNVAIEAVLAGVPVFVAPTSAAAPVGLTDLQAIESPLFPDRRAWLAHLAYSQFSLEEIASGVAWRMLLEWEERPFL
jgi:hypothetical protein